MKRPLPGPGLLLLTAAALAAQTVEIAGQQIPYEVRDGFRIIQGDIVVGRASPDPSPYVAPVSPAGRLWPGGVLYYTVDPDVPQAVGIQEAIRHWEQRTPIRFLARTDQPNYVRFRRTDSGCWSAIGMTGGEQAISLHSSCNTATIIHEIGHAVGLWHEQSREDRDRYLDLHLEAIDPVSRIQWQAHIQDGNDWGPYDFASIMHYSTGLLDSAGGLAVETKPAGIPTNIGTGLSVGDIDGVRRLYGAPSTDTTIATHPDGLPVTVDGTMYTGPHGFPWSPGTVHSLEVPQHYVDGATRYVFGRWSDEGPLVHEVQASAEVTAYTAAFQVQYRALARSADETQGAVAVETDGEDHWATNNSVVRYRATPKPGFYFVRWVTDTSPRPVSAENPLELRARGSGVVVVAEFSAQPPTIITSDPPGIPIVVDGLALRTPVANVWEPGSQHTLDAAVGVARGGDEQRDTFLNWSEGGERRHSITASAGGGTITAHFLREFHVAVSAARQFGGSNIIIPELPGKVTVEPASEDGFFPAGTQLRLTATANAGFEFVAWTGDASATAPVLGVSVDRPLLLGAWFAKPGVVSAGDVLDGTDYLPGPVSPGGIVSLFGIGLGPGQGRTLELDADGRVSTSLAGTEVRFDGIPAPILYTSGRQVNVVAPYGIAGRGQTQMSVTYLGRAPEIPAYLEVAPAAPGFFTAGGTGRGQIAAINQDGSPNNVEQPAEAGSVIVLYATGTGVTSPASQDGAVTGEAPPRVAAALMVWIGWRQADILYAGAAPGLVAGLTQINVRIPRHLSGREIPVVLEAAGARTPNFFTIAVR